MENVIIIVQHTKNNSQLETEAKNILNMMTLIDSFVMFKQAYDVIDIYHSRAIKKEKHLLKKYLAVTPAAFEFIIGKN